jgi:murein DD-endopeptidase MepM/ murein hydrolase activator NlpD
MRRTRLAAARPAVPAVGLRTLASWTSLGVGALALAAAAPGAHAQRTGGVEFRSLPWLAATAFDVSPATLAPGATLTIGFRIEGRVRRARVRIDLVPEAGGRPAATLRLGRRRTNRDLTATWQPQLAPGRYTARLRATSAPRRRRSARLSRRSAVEVVAPPVAASTGVFPVQGPYTLGGKQSVFGAPRSGHRHQGHDIFAAEGTPVVAPRAGSVGWRAYQAEGAGHYVVLRADDGRDYVFMHLQDGSVIAEKGQSVAAGEQIAAVGSTGRATGAHLHFEIWPDGWWADGSEPIDPLPDLLAWAGS